MSAVGPAWTLTAALLALVAAALAVAVGRRRPFFSPPLAVAWVLAVIALAGPRWGSSPQPEESAEGVVWLAVDVSRSMLAADVPGNRLQRAKQALLDGLDGLGDREVGLIAFAEGAKVVAPPTRDRAFLRDAIADLSTGSAPRGGSDLGAALALVAALPDDAGRGAELMVLVSDGGHEPIAAEPVEQAVRRGLVIVTVGIGDPEETSPIPMPGGGFLREEGEQVRTRLDESRLRRLASETGGFYVPARRNPVDLAGIVGSRALPRVRQVRSRLTSAPAERYQLFLAPALLLAALESLWPRRRHSESVVERGDDFYLQGFEKGFRQ